MPWTKLAWHARHARPLAFRGRRRTTFRAAPEIRRAFAPKFQGTGPASPVTLTGVSATGHRHCMRGLRGGENGGVLLWILLRCFGTPVLAKWARSLTVDLQRHSHSCDPAPTPGTSALPVKPQQKAAYIKYGQIFLNGAACILLRALFSTHFCPAGSICEAIRGLRDFGASRPLIRRSAPPSPHRGEDGANRKSRGRLRSCLATPRGHAPGEEKGQADCAQRIERPFGR